MRLTLFETGFSTKNSALEDVERLRPDLVVLDIYLPDMSGLTVLHELQQRNATIDVIMGTAARIWSRCGWRWPVARGATSSNRSTSLANTRRCKPISGSSASGRRSTRVEQEGVDRLYATIGIAREQSLPKNLNRPTLEWSYASCTIDRRR